jgi:hypothetical protein
MAEQQGSGEDVVLSHNFKRPNNLGEQFHTQLVEAVFHHEALRNVCPLVVFRLHRLMLENLLNGHNEQVAKNWKR